MEKKTVNLWDINVPQGMLISKPKIYKLMGMEAFYKRYKKFCGRIIVDKHYNIIDGYVIYCTAKRLKVNQVPVTVVSRMDRFKHFCKGVIRKWKER